MTQKRSRVCRVFQPGRALARNDPAQGQHLHRNVFQFAPPRDFPLRGERPQTIRLKDRVHLGAVAQLVNGPRTNGSTLTSYDHQQPDVLALRQPDPEIVIHRHQRRSLRNRRHRADEDAIYLFFAECLKESAERAVLRL